MRRFFLLIIIFCAATKLFALDNKYEKYFSFSVTPQFEVATGNIKEYVFDSDCKNTDNKLSELDWNVSTISLFNLQADFDIIKYIYVGLSGTAGVPQRTDFMQDYDWLNGMQGYPESWNEDDPTEYTRFSEHINKLDKFISFKINLGGNIYLPLDFKLTPHIAYQYEFIRFSATGGYGEYKNDLKELDKQVFTGKVISYEQEANTVFLGLNVISEIIPKTTIKINFDISPMLTFLNATDYHYINLGDSGTAYQDRFKNITQIDTSMTAQFRFTKNHRAGIFGRIQYIPLSKGNTYSKSIDKKGNFTSDTWVPENDGNGGTERYIWSLGLNYSFSL